LRIFQVREIILYSFPPEAISILSVGIKYSVLVTLLLPWTKLSVYE